MSSITIDVEELYRLGDFTWLVIHELGHALGFGEVWHEPGLLSDPSDPIHGAPGPIEPVEDMGYEVDYDAADPYTVLPLLSVQPRTQAIAPNCGTGAGPWYRVGNSGSLSVIRW